MRDHLLQGVEALVVHPYQSELPRIYDLIDAGAPVIIPRRDLDQVIASWRRHGKDLKDFAGRSLDGWMFLQDCLAVYATVESQAFYLNIDHPETRDQQLAVINRELGLSLDARGWPVIREEPRRTGMSRW